MKYQKEYPKKIKINAFNDTVYAFDITDDKDNALDILECIYCVPLIDELHEEFIEWLKWFWSAEPGNKMFPWNEWNRKGIELTRKLSIILCGTGIEIYYQKIEADCTDRNSDLIKIK